MKIQTHTIDVGIDLGTTNSSVAIVIDGVPVIVPNNQSHETTPSAVRIRANGGLDVGEIAYQRARDVPGDVALEFKRWIGTQQTFEHIAAGRASTAVELSAEVLKALRADVEQRHEVTLRAAVITVPAAFELNQCAGTQAAATLAGLRQAPLLQEPVAASLAYGYSIDAAAGNWLVYDLGGGTFDLALVGVRDGQIQVIDHEGDNYLGGKDFDWLIVEGLIIPALSKRYSVGSFQRSNPARGEQLALLKHQAEELKILLSSRNDATVTIESGHTAMRDDAGVEIECDLPFLRAQYEAAIEPLINRTVQMCQGVLSRNPRTPPGAILLVGGPTLTPYVRRRLGDLGVSLAANANPMTVVAEGAALYAASQPLAAQARTDPRSKREPDSQGATLEVRTASVTEDEEAAVGLTVSEASAATLEVASADGSWRSGKIPLRSSAAVLSVPLRLRGANKFLVEVFAESGSRVEVTPGEFSIHRGLTAAAAPLSRSIGVVLRDEGGGGRKTLDWLVKKDTPLPVHGTYLFRTTLALEPGGEVEVVGVYLVEGESTRPDRNRVVGSIEITDSDVPRTVPAGSPVEITLEISASRMLTARVFLPLTDQTFNVEVQVTAEQPSVADLTMALLGERDRLDAAAAHLTPSEITSFNAEFVDVSRRVNSLSQTDHGASQQTLMSLKSLQERLDQADAKFDLPRACADGRQEYDLASEVAVPMGSESQVRRLDALGVELDQAIEGGDIADIERSTSKIVRLRFEVLAQQPWFWKEWFEQLSTSATAWRDETEAKRFMRDGATALSRDDVAGLRRATLGLSALAPGQQGSFSNVGLRRG